MTRYSRLLFLLFILALFCAPLAMHIYLGSFGRFMADDFCFSATTHSYGIIRGAWWWYLNWTGRYSSNLLDSFFGYLSPSVIPYLTGIVVTTWFIVLSWTLAQIVPVHVERGGSRIVLPCLFAAMILFAVLDVIPLVGQSLYWAEAMRSVVPPLILGTGYIGLVVRGARNKIRIGARSVVVAILLPFVATGFQETYFAVQTSAIVIALLFVATGRNRKQYLPLLIAGLAGSFAGGLIDFVAPGNSVRQSAFPPPPAPPELLTISLRGLRDFFDVVVFSPPRIFTWIGIFICAFVAGLIMSSNTQASLRRRSWMLVLLPIITLVLLIACWVPMAYATSLLLHFRTYIIPVYVLVVLSACWAYVAGSTCARALFSSANLAPVSTVLAAVVFLAFGLLALERSRHMFELHTTFANYARAWDERDRIIKTAKAQGATYAIVRPLHNSATIDEIELDPRITWLTKCVDGHYGIAVVPQLGDLKGEPNGQAKQAEVEQHFQSIHPAPNSTPAPLNDVYHTERGRVGFYNTNSTADQIKTHYQTELARLGWKYIGEKKIEAAQRFTGGTQTLFCYGDVAANLFITGGDEQRLGYTYSLALNWGMSGGYVWNKVDCPQ
jgi:hypothetical protein